MALESPFWLPLMVCWFRPYCITAWISSDVGCAAVGIRKVLQNNLSSASFSMFKRTSNFSELQSEIILIKNVSSRIRWYSKTLLHFTVQVWNQCWLHNLLRVIYRVHDIQNAMAVWFRVPLTTNLSKFWTFITKYTDPFLQVLDILK